MQDLLSLFSIGLGFCAAGFWLLFFVRTRKNLPDDGESRRKSALRALLLTFAAAGLIYSSQFIPRVEFPPFPYPMPDAFVFMAGVALWATIGMIININLMDNNQAVTPFQKKVNFFTTVVMISAIVWAIVPYLGFIFFPRMGLPLDVSIFLTGALLAVLATLDLAT